MFLTGVCRETSSEAFLLPEANSCWLRTTANFWNKSLLTMEEPEPGGQEDVKDFGEMNAIGGVLHIKTTTGEERFLDVDIVNDTASVFGYDLKWQAIRRSWTR
jgi:hypothetical protein